MYDSEQYSTHTKTITRHQLQDDNEPRKAASRAVPPPELCTKSLQPLESQMWEDSIIWGRDSEDEGEEDETKSSVRRDEKRARKMPRDVIEEDEVRCCRAEPCASCL
jgi:hypothetical protein